MRNKAFATLVLLLTLGGSATLPQERSARNLGLQSLVHLLDQLDDASVHLDVLRGIHEALQGRRRVPMPEGWPAVYRKLAQSPNPEVREKAMILAVTFGDVQAIASLKQIVQEPTAGSLRQSALQALISNKNADLVPLLHALLTDRALRSLALRGLAAYPDEATPRLILKHYASFTESEKADAIQTLASRRAFALALLEAVERGQIPRRDLSAFTVRQMLGLKETRVLEKLTRVWGPVRPASQEKGPLMARYKALLTPDYLRDADRSRGRLLFTQTCAVCHKMFGEGSLIGPELTGAQRTNLDYVMGKLLDPSAVVAQDYRVTILQTRDGRVITGIIKQENDHVVTIQTQNESISLPKSELEERTKSPLSMMPEGLLAKLKNDEVRDLIAYLASPAQVPLPGKAATDETRMKHGKGR